ncbi:hypothetical protein BJ742DRAFT_673483 [Cladochytrium replicatum]|nr:hypothetical protein BJ742DRAFT_673483 [Cladochytrium replicatum]
MSSADNSNDSPGKGGVANLRAEGITLKRDIQAKESHLSLLESALYEEARHIPNDTHPSTPVGDESACEVILTIGEPRPNPNGWALKDHFALAQLHDMADFDRAGKVTGNSFYYLKNTGALLELAMIRYTMDVCVRHGFVPILTPDLVRHEIVEACGFSPRSSDPQTYFIQPPFIAPSQQPRPSSVTIPTPGNDPLQLTLTATAEFPLCAMHANEVLMPSTLPVKMVGFGHSFRAEGTTGGTNRGLYRVHQFSKVEMFALTRPEQSDKILEEFREIQTEIFTSLGLCFRVLNMSTEELGAPAYKKYDMEAWMPARNEWGEISSASNCTDYQSRRLNIRHFTATATSATSAEFVHTVNGTACAVPRLIIAILETFQNEKGEIEIPKVLRPYFLGANVEKIIPGKSVRELLLAKS